MRRATSRLTRVATLSAASAVTLGLLTPPTLATALPAATSAPAPAAASAPAHAVASDASDQLVRELRERSGADVVVKRSAATGRATFVGTRAGKPVARPADVPFGAGVSADATARGYLRRYGVLFGVRDQARDLRTLSVVPAGAASIAKYGQRVDGVPVLGGEVVVSLDAQGNLVSLNGETSAARPGTTATVPSSAAARIARGVSARVTKAPVADLTASEPVLQVADPAVVGGLPAPRATLVWAVEVRGPQVRRQVLVDAARGSVVLNLDLVAEALNRYVCDRANKVPATDTCSSPYTRVEGGAPSTVGDVNAAYDYSGDVYRFLSTVLGRDSLDDKGMPLKSTVRYCPSADACPYENAYWDGRQMIYGWEYAKADDVVGHELAHGLTDYTAGLYYFYQSGAVSESMSDVFGEFVDQWNARDYFGRDASSQDWLVGEDLPGGAIRSLAGPTLYGQPNRMRSSLYFNGLDPDYQYVVNNGGVHYNSGVGNKAAYLIVAGGASPADSSVKVPPVSGASRAERIVKAAKIYYRTLLSLTSSSDYADLANVLPQACDALVGTSGIVQPDCDATVRAAVTATEMSLPPLDPKAATVAEAAVCPTGTMPSNAFFDDLENPSTWSTNFATGAVPGSAGSFYVPQTAETFAGWDPTYARSGSYNIWGDDAGSYDDAALYQDSWVQTRSITVPSAGTPYLRFDHAFAFESDLPVGETELRTYDAGVVEYSVNGGGWTDAGALIKSGAGYNGVVNSGDVGQSLEGRSAFVASSAGYTASRLDLSALAGQSVQFRWRIATDGWYGSYGWFLDDIRVYRCVSAPAPGAPTVGTATATDASAKVTWTAPAPVAGAAPVTGYRLTATSGATTRTARVGASATSGTVGGLTNGLPWTVSVQAESAVGLGAASAQSNAVTPRWRASIVITPSPTTIPAGASGTLTVTVVRTGTTTPVPGAVVQVFGRRIGSAAGTAWTAYGQVRTDAAGRASYVRQPAYTNDYLGRLYESVAVAGPSVDSAPRRIYVAHKVSAKLAYTTVRLGHTQRVTGTVSPRVTGAKVYLQRYVSGKWVELGRTGTVSSTGTYAITYTPTARAAKVYLRVRSAATAANLGGYSPSTYFSVT